MIVLLKVAQRDILAAGGGNKSSRATGGGPRIERTYVRKTQRMGQKLPKIHSTKMIIALFFGCHFSEFTVPSNPKTVRETETNLVMLWYKSGFQRR